MQYTTLLFVVNVSRIVLVGSTNWWDIEMETISCEDYPKILETAGHISVYIYLDEPGFDTRG